MRRRDGRGGKLKARNDLQRLMVRSEKGWPGGKEGTWWGWGLLVCGEGFFSFFFFFFPFPFDIGNLTILSKQLGNAQPDRGATRKPSLIVTIAVSGVSRRRGKGRKKKKKRKKIEQKRENA